MFINLLSERHTFIYLQRAKLDVGNSHGMEGSGKQLNMNSSHLYSDLPGPGMGSTLAHPLTYATKLGIPVPNLAPDVEHEPTPPALPSGPAPFVPEDTQKEPRKKKYAKEAWPGKKPTHNLLV